MGKAQKHRAERQADRQAAAQRRARRNRRAKKVGILLTAAIVVAIAIVAWPKKTQSPAATASPVSTSTTNSPIKAQTMTIQTAKGTIKVELNPDKAPKTVAHITELVSKGFYNGLVFHRVVPGFVVQGGDPKGDGTGGSGQNIPFEDNDLKHDKGVIAMARSQDRDSADSQFYITLDAQPSLDGNYVVFGKVIAGMDVVEQIVQGDKMTTVTIP